MLQIFCYRPYLYNIITATIPANPRIIHRYGSDASYRCRFRFFCAPEKPWANANETGSKLYCKTIVVFSLLKNSTSVLQEIIFLFYTLVGRTFDPVLSNPLVLPGNTVSDDGRYNTDVHNRYIRAEPESSTRTV